MNKLTKPRLYVYRRFVSSNFLQRDVSGYNFSLFCPPFFLLKVKKILQFILIILLNCMSSCIYCLFFVCFSIFFYCFSIFYFIKAFSFLLFRYKDQFCQINIKTTKSFVRLFLANKNKLVALFIVVAHVDIEFSTKGVCAHEAKNNNNILFL